MMSVNKRGLTSLTKRAAGRLSLICLAAVGAMGATTANAGTMYVKIGPPSTGNGGANPLGIPPSVIDMEFSYLTDSKWETSLGICPGLTLGKRQQSGGFYLGYGGGLIINSNGSGLGPYTSFGWESSSKYKFGAEYKQAIGATSAGMIFPYAVRLTFGFGL
jgi:hypothetical protein